MSSRPVIGLVTVTYNSADVLPEFLRCVGAQSCGELLLFAVDNASKDATVEVLRSCSDRRLRLIANAENRGVAEGNNQGIRAALEAGCESILLINNDTAFGEELVEQLAEGLMRHNCDMVCPKILYFDEPARIWAAGGEFQPMLGYRARHFGEGRMDRGEFDAVRRIEYVPTCCVLIRREVFASVGLMDSRYFVYVDDVDFMYRAKKAGKVLMYLPELQMLHKVGYLTGGQESAFSIYYGTRNRLFFLLKSFGMFRSAPWMMLCQAFWLLPLLLQRKRLPWFKLKQKAFRASVRMWAGKDMSGWR